MKSKFEQYIHQHREDFDSEHPSPDSWQKLKAQLSGDKKPIVKNLFLRSWLIAAAMTGVAALLVFTFIKSPGSSTDPRAVTPAASGNTELMNEINPSYAKEVYHFTQLIEIKQNELKKLQKADPVLYNHFIKDITRLDSSYNALQTQLPENPNREQLLEAMIQNLRLQTDLLNEQLLIIQKIKQSKNKINETNSKSI
jgi:hypothetical protein